MRMIRTISLLPVFLICLPLLLSAQMEEGNGTPRPEKRVLQGVLIDASTKTPLAFATVTLFGLPDTSVVTGNITDEAGRFTLLAQPGDYFLRAQFLSYQTNFTGGIQLSASTTPLDLGKLQLQPNASILDEVVIRAEKSQLQFGLDKQVFNVGKDLANKGGSAADVLDNVPSVTVDVEGNVSLRGSENVRILIDGKPSGLVSFGSNGLNQLPANMIDRIEVITNPSARYEAEGMAGVINIVLKKEQQYGLNGSFDLNTGYPDNYGASININMRRDKFNFFSNYGVRYQNRPGSGAQYQTFYGDNEVLITDQNSERMRGGISNNFRFGSDYFLTPKDVLTTAVSIRYQSNKNTNTNYYRDFIGDLNHPDGSSKRRDEETEKEPNTEYSLSYKKSYDREGHTLSADLRYQNNIEKSSSDLLEQYFGIDGNLSGQPDLTQRSQHREGERNIIAQLDYVKPFSKDGKFELGGRSGLRNISNDYLVETLLDNDWTPLAGLTNNVIYKENIYAAYAILGNKISKFSWQAGLRTEIADVKTELQQTNEINDRPLYTNLFPSAHVGYEMRNENSVQLSYSRRIRRPNFWDLNPFFSYSDSRNFWSGNPDLQPEYTDAYELGHLKRWGKASLNTAIFYRHSTDVVERLRTQLSDTSSFTKPVNLAQRDEYGLSVTGSVEPVNKWQINGNLNFFRSITDGSYEGQVFNADTYTWFGRVSSRVSLWKKVNVQTTFNYRAPRKNTQGKEKAMYHADLGISTDILRNNGTLTFSVNDVFNTRSRRYITQGSDFYTEGTFQWRARQTTLSFTYRINRQKEPAKERGDNGDGGGEF